MPDAPLDPDVTVERRGPAEWIVAAPGGGRPLHVYRIGPGDWLVSEVGRSTEGRGPDLRGALSALDAPVWHAAMGEAVVRALGREEGSAGRLSAGAREA